MASDPPPVWGVLAGLFHRPLRVTAHKKEGSEEGSEPAALCTHSCATAMVPKHDPTGGVNALQSPGFRDVGPAEAGPLFSTDELRLLI